MAVTGLLLQWGCLEGVNPDLPAALAALDAGFTNHQQESFVTETALFAFAYTNMQVYAELSVALCAFCRLRSQFASLALWCPWRWLNRFRVKK